MLIPFLEKKVDAIVCIFCTSSKAIFCSSILVPKSAAGVAGNLIARTLVIFNNFFIKLCNELISGLKFVAYYACDILLYKA